MIPTLRLPAALTAAALLLGSGSSLCAADDATPSATPAATTTATPTPTPTPTPDPEAPARHQAADALLDSLHMQATVEMSSKRLLQSADQIADRMEKQPNATPEAIAEAKKLREELHTLITQGLGWEAIKPDLVAAYADDFTVAELKELDTFYHTPVGQKFVEKQPAMTTKMGQIMQQRSKAVFPVIQQKIQAATAKTRPTPPPAPPVPPTGATAPMGLPPAVPKPPTVTTSPVPAPPAEASATPTAPPAGTPKFITPVMPVTPSPM